MKDACTGNSGSPLIKWIGKVDPKGHDSRRHQPGQGLCQKGRSRNLHPNQNISGLDFYAACMIREMLTKTSFYVMSKQP